MLRPADATNHPKKGLGLGTNGSAATGKVVSDGTRGSGWGG